MVREATEIQIWRKLRYDVAFHIALTPEEIEPALKAKIEQGLETKVANAYHINMITEEMKDSLLTALYAC